MPMVSSRFVRFIVYLIITWAPAGALAQTSWSAEPEPFFFSLERTVDMGIEPRGLTTVDLNGDGKPDIIAANQSSPFATVLLNGAAAPFNVAVGGGPRQVAVGDVDGDGDLDLASANYRSFSVSVTLNNGDLTFAPPTHYPLSRWPSGAALADFDGDGDLDLVGTTEDSPDITGGVWMLRNFGDGTFSVPERFVNASFPSSMLAEDLDADGDNDLVIGGSFGTLVLRNGGDATFDQTFYSPGFGFRQTSGDMDGDGDLDILTASYRGGGVHLLRNAGGGTFQAERVSSDWTLGVTKADFDGDGDLDIAEAAYYFGTDRLNYWRNRGNGTFDPAGHSTTGGPSPVDVTAVDLDADGHPDLANVNFNLPFRPPGPGMEVFLTVPGVTAVRVGDDFASWIVQLNEDDLDTTAAESASNYRVTAAHGDANDNGNPFDDGDETERAVSAVAYDPESNRLTVGVAGVLLGDIFRLELDGDGATSDSTGGLADPDGHFIFGGDFTVTLDLTASQILSDLIDAVEAQGFGNGVEQSLLALLYSAQRLLENPDTNDTSVTNRIDAFLRILEIRLQTGDITQAQYDSLRQDAEFLLQVLELTN